MKTGSNKQKPTLGRLIVVLIAIDLAILVYGVYVFVNDRSTVSSGQVQSAESTEVQQPTVTTLEATEPVSKDDVHVLSPAEQELFKPPLTPDSD